MRQDIDRASVRLENELRTLKLEDELVAAAQNSKSRRGSAPSSESSTRANQVSREQVIDLLERKFRGQHLNSGHLARAFADEGISMTTSAAKQHLRRLQRDGGIGRDGSWFVYGVPAPESFHNGNGTQQQTSPDGGSRRGGEQEHGPGDGRPISIREFSGATVGG